ncbi:hypothetical protein Kpol_1050p71 [Vanderwaltozyma polyspora DSM 70294]|uniref:PEX18/PEX21 C-terminal domain-containing protein n=1 Tax=Vanderwaltozyma polyspora (strain ATCC 22028 / DSM 70294 / BCRC 21397 / CBS 2163 / NBRC 10782 / NRRL Y-8283 / UCD 57-17) TaxID=436907 RepID=A7TEW7_VANPO|nr:uncharacterized protein Kpol_1050p71 [Vanderwaltozyma polyspora DSM 70294]EDO19213.1 hypothetical protein Kpol_1050p71 [Vanderwaltozyma polyspora DSM 70294]
MSSVCQSNPLQQFARKGEQATGRWRLNEGRVQNRGGESIQNSVENEFLRNDESLSIRGGNQPHNMFGRAPAQMGHSSGVVEKESWLNEFSKIAIKDPLEFSDRYKQLYSNYETRQTVTSMHNQGYYQPMSNMNLHVQQNWSMMEGQINQSMNSQETAHIDQAHNDLDMYLEKEFNDIELELQELDEHSHSEFASGVQEQQKFKEIATDIVDTCITNNKNSTMTSKLAKSKFMGLMMQISDGEVTLKIDEHPDANTNAKELYSTKTGKTVGNDFHDIQDTISDI